MSNCKFYEGSWSGLTATKWPILPPHKYPPYDGCSRAVPSPFPTEFQRWLTGHPRAITSRPGPGGPYAENGEFATRSVLLKTPSHGYTIRLVEFAPSTSLLISGCILVGILLKANDGELKGAIYFHCLPPKAEVDFIYYPSKLLSFDEARALAENLLANAQSGHFKGYRWERAVP